MLVPELVDRGFGQFRNAPYVIEPFACQTTKVVRDRHDGGEPAPGNSSPFTIRVLDADGHN